jgi:hypothetical protein
VLLRVTPATAVAELQSAIQLILPTLLPPAVVVAAVLCIAATMVVPVVVQREVPAVLMVVQAEEAELK